MNIAKSYFLKSVLVKISAKMKFQNSRIGSDILDRPFIDRSKFDHFQKLDFFCYLSGGGSEAVFTIGPSWGSWYRSLRPPIAKNN